MIFEQICTIGFSAVCFPCRHVSPPLVYYVFVFYSFFSWLNFGVRKATFRGAWVAQRRLNLILVPCLLVGTQTIKVSQLEAVVFSEVIYMSLSPRLAFPFRGLLCQWHTTQRKLWCHTTSKLQSLIHQGFNFVVVGIMLIFWQVPYLFWFASRVFWLCCHLCQQIRYFHHQQNMSRQIVLFFMVGIRKQP